MKTTVDIPEELFREAKAAAARDGAKLKDLVADGLRLVLGKPKRGGQKLQFPLIPGWAGAARLTAAKASEVEEAEDRVEDSRHARARRR